METTLVVVRAFGAYAIGDHVTAAEAIATILASDHANYVVKITPPQTEG